MTQQVMVSGASGYLGSWVVDSLLRAGYRVHGTVRSLADSAKLAHLEQMKTQYPDQLFLFEADLLTPGSFDAAMAGCTIVFHTASPYFLEKTKNPEQTLLRPALNGTANVIDSIERCESVRRLVLTSSVVSLYDTARSVNAKGSPLVTAADVNTGSRLDSNPYAFSKTQAEQLAWQRQRQQQRWSLVTLHPGGIFGPSLSRRIDGTSAKMMQQFVDGSFRQGVPRMWLGVVDVRDVALAHLRAAEQGKDQQRYILVAQGIRLLDLAHCLDGERFNIADKLPSRELPKWLLWLLAPLIGMSRRDVAGNMGYPLEFDNQPSRDELGIQYHSLAQTMNDHAAQLLQDGLVKGR
ncbi:NAD-dependent epimerase/dehydratase family protein [Saccharospirillum mangrovi]|uniref:NAD-dependent epimerase/dehydratase family protein n=1 Tax=Saccharospirillum mangrovi TaxID=2161747 RepID=UPI000D369C16|nr:NAD-dependent epimerase/dehydratase family protein [Saccharospirillum mangrovi]